jgi:hypothetical protein
MLVCRKASHSPRPSVRCRETVPTTEKLDYRANQSGRTRARRSVVICTSRRPARFILDPVAPDIRHVPVKKMSPNGRRCASVESHAVRVGARASILALAGPFRAPSIHSTRGLWWNRPKMKIVTSGTRRLVTLET